MPSVNSIENFPDLILGHDTFARSLDQLKRAISIHRDAQELASVTLTPGRA